MSGRLVNPWTPGNNVPAELGCPPHVRNWIKLKSSPTNPGFETGDFTGWTAATGYNVVTTSPYLGTYTAQALRRWRGLALTSSIRIKSPLLPVRSSRQPATSMQDRPRLAATARLRARGVRFRPHAVIVLPTSAPSLQP